MRHFRYLVPVTAAALFATVYRDGQTAAPASRTVELVRTPQGGVQPQAVAGADGTIHLSYLKGDPAAAEVLYSRRRPRESGWSSPLRAGTGVAMGTIRGPQLAIGKNGRAHLVWFGSQKGTSGGHGGAPLLYSRLNDTGTAFEGTRNLMGVTRALDGGPGLAADGKGGVYVLWHANMPGEKEETRRRVWIARSRDDGKSFAAETPAWEEPTGACACCSLEAFADSRGELFALYRSAESGGQDRDMFLLSGKAGEPLHGMKVDRWKINACPMSSESFAEGPTGIVAAWETAGQVYWSTVDRSTGRTGKPVAAPGSADRRKHPALAVNARGEVLLAWTEGTGWNKGGTLAWQLYGPDGRPKPEKGRVEGGIPVWGLATAIAGPDGGFTIVH